MPLLFKIWKFSNSMDSRIVHCLEFPITRFCRVLMSFDVMFASVMWIRGMCVTLVFNSLKYFSGSFLYVSLLWLASCLFI